MPGTAPIAGPHGIKASKAGKALYSADLSYPPVGQPAILSGPEVVVK